MYDSVAYALECLFRSKLFSTLEVLARQMHYKEEIPHALGSLEDAVVLK